MSQIEELRHLIVGDNAEQLTKLKERIENIESRTRDVLEVLPPAIDAGVKQDNRLIDALKTPVSESMKQAIRAEPTEYAEILYPVMGPSIRRAISQAMSSLLTTINQSIESATSVQGISLRIQSLRTGIPYAELALRQSLQYRVEHVYLIDRDSGLMISEAAAADDSTSLDSDAVSAMFAAIQSFVQDSFSHNTEDRLSDFKVGAHSVWIAHGPNAMLACVIFGDAPESLKFNLYDTLDAIRTKYSAQLSEFNGDSSDFVGVDTYLKPLLQLRLRDDGVAYRKSTKPSLVKKVLMLAVAIMLAYMVFGWINNNVKLSTVNYYLKKVSGLVVTSTFWQGESIVVEGLADPYAKIPYDILHANGIGPNLIEMQTTPFRSLEPTIERQRLTKELKIPQGVQLQVEQGILFISGAAPISWLLEKDNQIRPLIADDRLNADKLYVSEPSARVYIKDKLNGKDSAELQKRVASLTSLPWFSVSPDLLL